MRGRRIDVEVINASTLLSDKDARRGVAALQTQLRKHFAPVWDVMADLHFVGRDRRRLPVRPAAVTPLAPRQRAKRGSNGAWQLVLLDERNASYGYHELTRDGLPLGKVFLREAMKTRSGWTVTASHELLELLVDPETTLGTLVEDRSLGPRVYSYEVCDPVQDDRFATEVDGVAVSDFVYPAWFEPWRKRGSARFDHAEKLRLPFQVPRGCYAMFYDVKKRTWLDNWGGNVTPRLAVPQGTSDRGGSRYGLHGIAHGSWKKSVV
jgi:hypothetical protein